MALCNTFEGKVIDDTHVEFLGCEFECKKDAVAGMEPGTEVLVDVPFGGVVLDDNQEDGTLTGNISFILYKGDHYHITVDSDWDEDVYVDTNDIWDKGDNVGISIPADCISVRRKIN